MNKYYNIIIGGLLLLILLIIIIIFFYKIFINHSLNSISLIKNSVDSLFNTVDIYIIIEPPSDINLTNLTLDNLNSTTSTLLPPNHLKIVSWLSSNIKTTPTPLNYYKVKIENIELNTYNIYNITDIPTLQITKTYPKTPHLNFYNTDKYNISFYEQRSIICDCDTNPTAPGCPAAPSSTSTVSDMMKNLFTTPTNAPPIVDTNIIKINTSNLGTIYQTSLNNEKNSIVNIIREQEDTIVIFFNKLIPPNTELPGNISPDWVCEVRGLRNDFISYITKFIYYKLLLPLKNSKKSKKQQDVAKVNAAISAKELVVELSLSNDPVSLSGTPSFDIYQQPLLNLNNI